MRVIPYYCGKCGVRISPEDARFGQARDDERTHYCPTCVIEYGYVVEGSDQVELAADAARATSDDSSGAALDLTREKRVTSRRRVRSAHSGKRGGVASGKRSGAASGKRSGASAAVARASAARSSPMLLVLGLAIGAALAGGGVFLATRSDDRSARATPPATATASPTAVAVPSGPTVAEAEASPAPAPDLSPEASEPPSEPEPAPAETPAEPPGSFVLNLRSGTLHRQGCRWEVKMTASNRGRFDSLDEALRFHGELKQCRSCMRRK